MNYGNNLKFFTLICRIKKKKGITEWSNTIFSPVFNSYISLIILKYKINKTRKTVVIKFTMAFQFSKN